LVGPAAAGPFAQDSSGRIWFAHGRGGLGYVQDATVRVIEAPEVPREPINSMLFRSDGTLWIGQAGIIVRLKLDGTEFRETTVLGPDEGVPPGAIRVIHEDRTGDLWAGSYGGGIARCGPNGESFDKITTSDGLADNSVSALLEDENERFWILGNRGVSVVRRAVLDSVVEGTRVRVDAVLFGESEGMPEGNGGSPAGWLDDRGVAWFATIDGLVAFETNEFPSDTIVPIPVVETVLFGDEPWAGTEPIVVGGGDTEVSFRFLSSTTGSPSGTLYRYRLRGQDQNWVYSATSGFARYPRVPPGRYVFALEARNEDGLWSREPTLIEFQILPDWWQTRWFQWGAGLLAALLAGTGLFRRVRTMEARNLQLTRVIQQRDLAEERSRRQQRDLEHVARVATAGELATSLAHELNQPLTAIVSNAAAGDALLSNPDMGKEVVREALEEIVTEGRRASEVIKSLREFLRRGSVETEPLYVNQIVRDVLVLLTAELRESSVDVRLDLAGNLPTIDGNRVQLQQVLINLVMNAVDAMRGLDGEHRLSLKTRLVEDRDCVEVSVGDTGPGLQDGEEDRIFEAFVTTKLSGMGVGLAISRTLIGAHGGKIRGGNRPDGGAEFVFTLPIAETGAVSGRPDSAISG